MIESVSESAVRLGGAGELLLSGVLDYRTGPALRKQGQALIKSVSGAEVVIDCSAVQKSSSVGLSLLLCFMRLEMPVLYSQKWLRIDANSFSEALAHRVLFFAT